MTEQRTLNLFRYVTDRESYTSTYLQKYKYRNKIFCIHRPEQIKELLWYIERYGSYSHVSNNSYYHSNGNTIDYSRYFEYERKRNNNSDSSNSNNSNNSNNNNDNSNNDDNDLSPQSPKIL
jgi:hypothetical protein